ncbi:MAG: tandem-95 repeat protein, partial [Gammaproteobacteria bacterium]|nr:tandem-95 repeat protein [Gammaproteobacteria bacterium]
MADNEGLSSTANAVISVNGENDTPVAAPDSGAGLESQIITVDVLANDTDVDGDDAPPTFTLDSVSISSVTGHAGSNHGSVSIVSNELVFDPGTDFEDLNDGDSAIVTVAYTMSDSGGMTSISTATITVNGVTPNSAPTAVADTTVSTENATIAVAVLANDTDPDPTDDPSNFSLDSVSIVSASGLSGPTGGSVSINPAGELVFNPGTDFDELDNGDSSTVVIDYTMSDDSGVASSSTLTITVSGENDTPVAVTDSGAGDESEVVTIDVLANDADADDSDSPVNFTLDSVSISSVTGHAGSNHGSVSIVSNALEFDPGSDFADLNDGDSASVVVTYTMSDDEGASTTSTATITVAGVTPNSIPVANPDTASGDESQIQTIDVLDNDTDADLTDTLTLDTVAISLVTGHAGVDHGSVSIVNNQLVFDPGQDFEDMNDGDTATVTVTYSMSDDEGATANSTATITVTGITNSAPVAVVDTGAVTENDSLTIDVLANDTDIDPGDEPATFSLDTVSITTVTGLSVATGGSVSIVGNQLVFDPLTDFDELADGAIATVTIAYTMSDNEGASAGSTATITVTGTNDAPEVVQNDPRSVRIGGTRTLNGAMLAVDPDAADADLTYSTSTGPFLGQLELLSNTGVGITSFTQAELNSGDVVYVHGGVSVGADSFQFTVSDGVVVTPAQTFNIEIASGIIWTNATANDSWHTAGNWDALVVPDTTDFVIIDAMAGTVNHTTGTTTIAALSITGETLNISSSTLALNAYSTI